MTQPSQRNTGIGGAVWAGLILAAAVSTIALVFAVSPDRRALGVATAPFGWNRVIVIHALSALFLSWYLARTLATWQPALVVRWKAFVWAALGLAGAALTVLLGAGLQPALDGPGGSYTARLLYRVVWCAVLQLPWCMVGLAAADRPDGRLRPIFSSASLLALALVTALGVPISYLSVFLEQQTLRAQAEWQQEKLLDAHRQIQRLFDVGSTVSLGERPLADAASQTSVKVTPPMARSDLQQLLAVVEQRVGQFSSATLSDDNRLQLVRCHLALGQLAEASATLAPLAPQRPSAALLMAQISETRNRFDESRIWAEETLKLARQAAPASPEERRANDEIQMQAYDILAVLAGKEGDFQTAERYLLEALERLPARTADIHDRLGKHYEFVGEFPRALEHQRKAAEGDPANYPKPEGLVTKMLSTGAPVGLARPKSSRYQ